MSEKITILYVDDEPINLKIFELGFKDKFNILSAISGEEGLKKLQNHNGISVVISDMRMPNMNGLEFINTARKRFPHIIYYILTGYDITSPISKALEEKVIHKYFRKPINYKDIEFSIKEALI